ncbi:RIP metalloprotease RseP [Hydrogenibacillus sp. N12]|uniref:RIP metalloprotease RseP n=1 Tax=Hydrogenibacillus sp. N12 TaxID=2866627 RepID=UPI001C7D45CB|nr:RIP metalloprotease RseP [Hydrogenibacillus sp. N12]QZA33529.1 RIP metalloprotease RseP [Hydrogenibacillus sp. N12]
MPSLGFLGTALAIVAVFGLLVFVHELGHFLLARRAGILAREFAIGFGPKLFSFKPGETLWSVRLLPLGGYVRMAGEDVEGEPLKPGQRVRLERDGDVVRRIHLDAPEGAGAVVVRSDLERGLRLTVEEGGEERTYPVARDAEIVSGGEAIQIAPWDRQFGSKSLLDRFWVLVAGPLFNLLLAAVLFSLLALLNGVPNPAPVVGKVGPGTPAEAAGLRAGDVIRAVDGQPVASWDDLQRAIGESTADALAVDVERDGRDFRAVVRPKRQFFIAQMTNTAQIELLPGDEVTAIDGTPLESVTQAEALLEAAAGRPVRLTVLRDGRPVDVSYDLGKYRLTLGERRIIGIYQERTFSVWAALVDGPKETVLWIGRIFASLGALFQSHHPLDQLGGPVAIFKLTGDAAQRGFSTLLFWTALLSINLGVFNLLPIPALDGGRLLFLAIEAVRGRPIDQAKEGLVHLIGFALLLLFIVLVTWNDIQKLFLG